MACGVELAGFRGRSRGKACGEAMYGAGAALFKAGFIEEGVGVGVEEFVGEDWDGTGVSTARQRIAPSLMPRRIFDEAFEVHGFLQDILHHLVDEGMVGNLDVADDGLEAGSGLGKDGGHEVFGAGALDLRGDAFALGEAQQLEAAAGGPAPAVLEDGRRDRGLLEQFLGGVFGEEVEDVAEREAVLFGEGDVDAVVGGRGLQLEVEAAAEAFAQRESPGLIDAAAEGSVQDELHAAAVVEEALGDDGGLGRGQHPGRRDR